jgi:hypothetical protein
MLSVIKSIQIPRYVEKIGNDCFRDCKNLIELIFESGSGVKEIGEFAFMSCGLKSICIPNSVEKMGDACFYKCKSLSEVKFESNPKLTEICEFTFYKCGISESVHSTVY